VDQLEEVEEDQVVAVVEDHQHLDAWIRLSLVGQEFLYSINGLLPL
jgi:hypothetical protein